MADRMFHVLVLGGFALTGCGGTTGANAAPDADGAAGAPADGSFGTSDATGSSGADAATDAKGDGWIPIEGPQPPPDAGSADAPGDVLADASADGTIEPCSREICCTVHCCEPVICEGPQ